MATTADTIAPRDSRGFMADQPFFTRMAIALALLILFGFAQFAARGLVDIGKVPPFMHAHGIIMVAWLGLFVTQNLLVQRGSIAVHRTLGWAGVALAAAVVVSGGYTVHQALALGMVPPFFSNAFFYALVVSGLAGFLLLVLLAILQRRDTQAHRRLMLGSLILITEPAFGRLLPAPLIGGELTEWLILAIQLAMVALLARHDRKVLGGIHPATVVVAAVAFAVHLALSLLSRTAMVEGIAAGIAAG